MTMIEIVAPDGAVMHRSKNLRGVLDHARRSWVEEAVAHPSPSGAGGVLQVTYGDGRTCRTEFASYQVLCGWLRARRSLAWAGSRRIADSQHF